LNVLIVTESAPEEVKFIVLSAEAICRVMILEAAHTSDASFDPAMVLFKSIIQVDARPLADVAAQRRANCARAGIMPSVVTRTGTKPATDRAERKNAGRAQHHVDEGVSGRSVQNCCQATRNAANFLVSQVYYVQFENSAADPSHNWTNCKTGGDVVSPHDGSHSAFRKRRTTSARRNETTQSAPSPFSYGPSSLPKVCLQGCDEVCLTFRGAQFSNTYGIQVGWACNATGTIFVVYHLQGVVN